MSEELIQRNLIEAPEKMGDWNFYNIGATTLKALKGAKIIPDKDYEAYEGKKPDALIVKKPIIIAAIEYKTPQELRTEKQIAKAIAQEIGTAQILQAKVYIVTDGKKTFWINPATGQEILQEDGSRITLNFDKSSTECITLINKIRASINATNNQIKAAASVDPLPLAEKVWQDLWAVSGATPENCLYTFVEIFIFKYLSDLGVLKGMYPLYSGNTFGPFAQIDSYDYNVPALTWAIDGLAGYMMIHRSPFSATNHRGILLLKDTNIDLEYAKYTLEPIFRELKKGRQGDNGENEYTSLPPFMIQSVKFAVPVDHNGEPWLEKQKEIAAGYVTLEQTKETVVEQIANLSQVSIVPNCDEYAIEYLPLSELFDTIKGKSKYTKKYGNLHSGPYPVYSASSQGTLTHLDTYDYDGRYMTWSTNGFAGTILILDGKFSINGDRGILVPKNGRQDLDFDYMKFTLEPIFRELAKGRKGDNGEDEFTKLYPSMLNDIMVPIPVDGEGNISLSLQKEIAQKFISVQNNQKEIIEKLDALISKKISI